MDKQLRIVCIKVVFDVILYILNIHHQSKFARVPLILSGSKTHQDPALASYPVSSVKNAIERVENVKSLWFLQSPVPNPQASPRVEANDRHKQKKGCRKVQMETPESIRASLIPGEWVSCQTCRTRTVSFPSSKLKEVPDTVLSVDNKSGEVRTQPTQVFTFMGYEFHLDLALVNPLREMAQFSGFDRSLKVKHVFDFRMFDVANWVACLNGEMVPEGRLHLRPLFSFTLRSTGDILRYCTASFLGQSLFHLT